jgi:hypothetical protein
VRVPQSISSKAAASPVGLSPVHYVVAAALLALACLSFWQFWQASTGVKNASPVQLRGVTASFTSSERSQRALIFESNETSEAWLPKTDLIFTLPGGQNFRVHCAWSGNACPQIRAMAQRGPIDAVVLPVEFAPNFWLIEATAYGKPLAREHDQRRDLRSKLGRDRNLALAIAAAVLFGLWWLRWLRQPPSVSATR